MSKFHFIKRNENGQAMVEFAFVLPILLILVLGIVQFGILFHNYITLTDAVRAGARQGAVSGDSGSTASAIKRVRDAANDLKNPDTDLEITVTTRDINGASTSGPVHGGEVTVKATYPYSIKLLGVVMTDGRLISETTERVE